GAGGAIALCGASASVRGGAAITGESDGERSGSTGKAGGASCAGTLVSSSTCGVGTGAGAAWAGTSWAGASGAAAASTGSGTATAGSGVAGAGSTVLLCTCLHSTVVDDFFGFPCGSVRKRPDGWRRVLSALLLRCCSCLCV